MRHLDTALGMWERRKAFPMTSSAQGDAHKGKNAAIYDKLSEEEIEISFQQSIL